MHGLTRGAVLGVWLLGLVLAMGGGAMAQLTRVLPAGQMPDDTRLGPLKTLDDYFPFQPPKSREAWQQRAAELRRQLLVATGLWPMPTKTPPQAVVHGKVDRDQYTVERVYFQSFPGFYVTGSLYRPKNARGPCPAVLCPHGHWPEGRFHDSGETALKEQLVRGAERFDPAGRHPLQARCVQLARMGCVVFHYDMVGYADSVQLEHRPGVRPEMNTPERWGYFSPQAEARLETMMGLQTYNSVRALDWVSSLADVDPQRIGITGASGGGTQTFILTAIDPRPAVAFPAVMVSTAMQGGCTCENCSYLRVRTGNIEIAGLAAPRPLGMTAANDWTKELLTKGLPELEALYRLLGVPKNVAAEAFTWFPHNYNYVSRAVMYRWMNRHLRLGFKEPIVEEDFHPLTKAEMTVWDEEHPAPPSGQEFERSLLEWITRDSERQMAALVPRDEQSAKRFAEIVGGALEVLLGGRLTRQATMAEATMVEIGRDDRGEYELVRALVRCEARGQELPCLRLEPKNGSGQFALWVDRRGKAGLFDSAGKPRRGVSRLLAAGYTVVAVDLLGQGEFTADGEPLARQRINRSGRDTWAAYAGYTYGYNNSLFAERVQDILATVASLGKRAVVDLVALDGAGHWGAAARAMAGTAIRKAALDTAGFRFAQVAAIDDVDFLPGGAKYLDLPGMLAGSAPAPLWLSGESPQSVEIAVEAYRYAGHAERIECSTAVGGDAEVAATDWLLRQVDPL